MSSAISPRDQAALDAATGSGALTVPTAETGAELTPVQAVLFSLSRHLARVEARVENPSGPATRLRFVTVRESWPSGQEPAHYPSATLLPQFTSERDSVTGIPFVLEGEDLVTDAHALWQLGEDTGVGIAHIFATSRAQRDALLSATEQALYGDLDRLQGLALPLPEDALPAPFRGLLAIEHLPRAYVAHVDGGGPVGDAAAGASGLWRGDVYFRWQAPRWAARPRLSDLRTEIQVRVQPGEEP